MKLNTTEYEVTVRVNGHALREYDDPEQPLGEDSTNGTKYIEVIAGSNFIVHGDFRTPTPFGSQDDCVLTKVIVDGKTASETVSFARGMRYKPWGVDGARIQRNGRAMVERFSFASLVTDDSPLSGAKPEDFKNLGQIEVRCTLVRVDAKVQEVTGDYGKQRGSGSDETLSEKCLKGRAISNKVSFGDAQPVAGRMTRVTGMWFPYGRNPFGTYIFKYRSRRDLQIEDIIPRSPSPIALEDRDPEDLTLEQARELLRRQRTNGARDNQQADAKVMVKKEKRERDTSLDVDEDDEVVFEGRRNKRTCTSNDSGVEIIDLTD